jgi:purine-nucleoside phosphorylase
MREQLVKVKESVAFLENKTEIQPQIGIVLGTGLGGLADRIQAAVMIPYEEIPHFPVATVSSHMGRLIIGSLGGKQVMALQGRFHYYEGYDPKEITFPIRVMAAMGVETLLISNAAGGLNLTFEAGDLVLIRDHINLTGQNPLRGENVDEWGPRFPDMTEPYSRELVELAERVAKDLGIKLHQGVYVGVTGPRVHAGLKVLGMSVVTNVNDPEDYQPAPIEQVIATAQGAEPRLVQLVEEVLKRM